MTIAALAYDGVFRRHYLEADTIKYVGRPKEETILLFPLNGCSI
jgi:hypothetical protein